MNKTDIYKDVYAKLKKSLRWKVSDARSIMMIASLYVTNNKTYAPVRLDEIAERIRKELGFFNTLQSHHRYTFAAMLDTRFLHPEKSIKSFIQSYKALVDEGFTMGPYTYISAMVLISGEEISDGTSSRAMEVYKKMRKKHFFLTGQSDYPLAMLLARRTQDTDMLIEQIEYFYEQLNQSGFHKGNDLQTMSHILSLNEDVDSNVLVTRCKEIFDMLKDEGIRPKSMFYPQIAMLSFITNGSDHIAAVMEILESLNTDIRWQKDMNFIMAVTLHLSDQIENSSIFQTNLSTTIEALIQAQQSSSVAAIAGATAATSSGE
ncbi:DUF4003 family protein [Rossellomorea sp. NS-SX7]|uniref:DUF4003 family protein n=1 Tax=Rossellomorea sp. NS-SX7 TaxID=3463856 RepID=UPI00405819E6